MPKMLWFVICKIQHILPKYFVGRGVFAGIVFHNLKNSPEKWFNKEFSILNWVLLWVLFHNSNLYDKYYAKFHPIQAYWDEQFDF